MWGFNLVWGLGMIKLTDRNKERNTQIGLFLVVKEFCSKMCKLLLRKMLKSIRILKPPTSKLSKKSEAETTASG